MILPHSSRSLLRFLPAGLWVLFSGLADFALGQVPIVDHRVSRDGMVTLTAGLDNGSYLVLRTGSELSNISRPLQMIVGGGLWRLAELSGKGPDGEAGFFRVESRLIGEQADMDGDGRGDVFEWARPGLLDPFMAERNRTVQVMGTVVDEAGLPVTGAMVQIYDLPAPAVRTGLDGRFVLPAEVPGASAVLEVRWTDGVRPWVALRNVDASGAAPTDLGRVVLGAVPDLEPTLVAANRQASMAVRDGGELWGWGNNYYGVLGAAGGPTPAPVTSGREWRSLVMSVFGGIQVSYGIRDDGSLWSWGWATAGALGRPFEQESSDVPQRIAPGTRWRKVATGGCTLAIQADGSLWSWGYNEYGQLGIEENFTPIPAPVETNSVWLDVGVGERHSAAIRADGSLWTWGNNQYGQLGDGTRAPSYAPRRLGTGTSWKAVAASAWATFAIQADGTLWQWGRSLDLAGEPSVTPTRVGTQGGWTRIWCGEWHVVALREDHSLWTWGMNFEGLLGDGNNGYSTQPIRFGTGTNWVAAAAGMAHSVALQSDGTVWSWGNNIYGSLGIGFAVEELPLQQYGTNTNWRMAAAGKDFSVALDSSARLWAWGRNAEGQLGIGSTRGRYFPENISQGSRWRAVSCGDAHVLAIAEDGSLWSWGSNSVGQLGDGTLVSRSSPVRIGSQRDWAMVAAGGKNSYALRQDGSLWSVNGTSDNRRPVQLAPGTRWKSISAGSAHALGILDSGHLYAWGDNQSGQIGDGTVSFVPRRMTRIGNATGWTAIDASRVTSMASDSAGGTYVWGAGAGGLARSAGTPPYDPTRPMRIKGVPPASSVLAGPGSCILGNDGSLWGWGSLYGPSHVTDVPVRFAGDRPWAGVASGTDHLLLVGADGTLWIRGGVVKGLQGIPAARVLGDSWGLSPGR